MNIITYINNPKIFYYTCSEITWPNKKPNTTLFVMKTYNIYFEMRHGDQYKLLTSLICCAL